MLWLFLHIYIYNKRFKNPPFLGKFMVTTFEEAKECVIWSQHLTYCIFLKYDESVIKHPKGPSPVVFYVRCYRLSA